MKMALIFDTETTGKVEPQVIEAAWLHIEAPTDRLLILEEFEQRYKPSKPIELGALATHHIMDEELAFCPPHEAFRIPAETGYLIGHNVDFDWEVAGKPDVKRICTLALARYAWPGLDSYSQSALMYHLFRGSARDFLQKAHSAGQDIMGCRKVLRELLAVLRGMGHDVQTWEDLWAVSEHARTPTVMPFGKHKNTPIADLPRDYVIWMLKQTDMDPYVIKAVKQTFGY